jgi:hypothetical protein
MIWGLKGGRLFPAILWLLFLISPIIVEDTGIKPRVINAA